MKKILILFASVFLTSIVMTSTGLASGSDASLPAPNLEGLPVPGGAKLTWDAPNGAAGFNVYRNGEYKTTVIGATAYTDIVSAGTYKYYVTAFDDSKTIFSAKSNEVSVAFGDDSNPNGPVGSNLVDPASLSVPDINKDGYDLVLSDEFGGSELNRARWNTQLRWDGEYNGVCYEYRVSNGEDQFYVNIFSEDREHINTAVHQHNPFEFTGSSLRIRAVLNPFKNEDKAGEGESCTRGEQAGNHLKHKLAEQDVLSGVISTFDKFYQKYGYFEARIKIPNHTGTFPAFWLHHQRDKENSNQTEIDIMENLGHKAEYTYHTFHSDNGGENTTEIHPKPSNQIHNNVDMSKDYHVYAVKWEPGTVHWYIDGIEVSRLKNSLVDYEDLYVILNLAIGGNFVNFPTNAGGLGRPEGQRYPTEADINNFNSDPGPPVLDIDYVRVYKAK